MEPTWHNVAYNEGIHMDLQPTPARPSRFTSQLLALVIVTWLFLPLMVAGSEVFVEAKIPKVTLSISPVYARIEVATGAIAAVVLTLHLPEATSILAVSADCGCLQSRDVLPMAAARGDTQLHLQATGILPGMKTVTVRTTQGSATAQVQIVTPGFGESSHLIAELAPQKLLVIVHNLRGETRNCGCSTGSLGGIEHLAALHAALPLARLVLTGDAAGTNPAAVKALKRRGWEVTPADVVVSNDPLSALANADVTAIVCASGAIGGTPIANQRVVYPLLDRGAIAHVLVLSGNTVIAQRWLPIDRTLPSDLQILAELPALPPAIVIDHAAAPSTSCVTCHQAAHQAWVVSAHARALSSLSASDQTTACATCHTTGLPGRTERAAHVGCTVCHVGADAHAVAPATVRVSGIVDCRSCHDAQHHPGFDPVASWVRIQHGLR